jgi:3-phenylpropionate/trans-cinnamate dioxygenase ferredoxin reductase component
MNGSVVIVGSGQAGVSSAFKLRALGYGGKITLAGEEPVHPYHRPPLSKKYLTGNADAGRLFIKDPSLYERERIELLVDRRVVAIERARKRVVFADGGSLVYDALILATGARPRCLPSDLGADAPNVHSFRTLSDADRLRNHMTPGANLLVIGGGYIGLETAAVASSLGMQVTVIERDERILGRVASADTAAYFRALHQQRGVRIREGVSPTRLECDDMGAVKVAHLSDGTSIELDIVVVGIGVTPETALAEQADLRVDNGIVVDHAGRTSDAAIYAAGDCARFPYEDQLIRLESVQNAVDMAEIVARSIIGEPVEYRPVPWFWSDQYATRLRIAGLNLGYTHAVVRQGAGATLSIWYYDGPRFIAVDAINDAKAFMTGKQWLAAGRSPAADQIADATIGLHAVSLSEEHAFNH